MTPELSKLRTDLGDRPIEESVAQCNRCGYCEQVCPTYVLTGKEAFSGRGRNQIVRMMLEGKLADPKAAEEALSTCLLCGACTSVCYAHVATADHVLEARRQLRQGRLPRLARFLLDELAFRPVKFRRLLKLAYFFRRLGLAKLAADLGLLRLFGMPVLENAETHVEGAPARFLEEELAEDPALDWPRKEGQPAPDWLYFAPCGPNFLLTSVGKATVRNLKRLKGPGAFPGNGCCGLLHFNYGDLEQAKTLARLTIEQFETMPELPVIGDCSSCVAHLKSYPQMFLEDPAWLPRAEAFSKRVKDVIELYDKFPRPTGEVRPQAGEWGRQTYHDSCRARNGQGITVKSDAFTPLPESEWCCGGAGAFSFVHPELSDEVARRKVSNIASTQASVVATSSSSCLLQLAWALKKYYPSCRVMHLSELVDETQSGR